MKDDVVQRELMTRYLLGELSEAEREEIEEAYITDPSFLQELLAMRYDLIDGFVQGRLNATDHERFEQRLRFSPALQEKVEFAKALIHTIELVDPIRHRDVIPKAKQTRMKPGLLGLGPFSWPDFSIRPLGGVAAAALLIVAGIFWFARQSGEGLVDLYRSKDIASASPQVTQNPSIGATVESEKTQTTPQPSSTPSYNVIPDRPKILTATPAIPTGKLAAFTTSFLLTYDATRANSDQRELVIPAQAGTVRLRLEIEDHGARRYQAALQLLHGQKIWVRNNLPTRLAGSSRVVVCDLPIALLENENYVLRLQPRQEGDPIDLNYFFKVTKP